MTKAGPRYAIIPADAVTDDALVGPDLKVLALLGRHIDRKGWCVRSQGRMADELAMAVKTLQRSLSRLVDAGYVEISHETRRDGGQAANRYRVILDEDARADQLDLFATDAVRSSRAVGNEATRDAPPRSSVTPPLRHSGDAPPATPECRPQEERPLQETSPSNSRTELRRPHATPANDRSMPEDGPTTDPRPAAADRSGDDALARRLREAAGEAINTAHPAFINLAEPLGWLASGCDLEADVLPTVRGLAARIRGSPVRSWSYFAGAVREARDRRLAVATPVGMPGGGSPGNIVPFNRGGPDGRDHEKPVPRPGRFAKQFALRRQQFGDGAGGAHDPD